jgi:adenylylsulfate kinase-like enzyme
MYKKARAGEIKGFTGVDDPYEPPTNPDVLIRADRTSPQEAAVMLLSLLEKRGDVALPADH